MNELEKLRQKKADALAKIDAINLAATAEERELTEEQEAKLDALLAEAKEADTGIKALEARLELRAARSTEIAALNAPRGRRASPDAVPAPTAVITTGVHERAEDDPNRGFRHPREFMMAVLAAGCQRGVDPRLAVLRVKPSATAGSDEQGTYADPYGGFLVPAGFSPDLLQIGPEADPVQGRVTQIPMESPVVKMPARVDKDHSTSVSGGLRVYRRAETDTSASSRVAFEQVVLNAMGLFGLAYVSEELLTDSPISFAALLATMFGDEYASVILNERLNGTGVGEFMGVMTSPCLISITKETGQAPDTIVYGNVVKMRARVWGYGNAVWLANQDCLPQLATLNLQVGTAGIPVWQPSLREDVPDILMGRPLFFTEYMKTVGDTGDIGCFNFSQFLEGVYQPLEQAESIHVRFIYNERAFRFTMRNAGAPWWKSELTPKNGATLSPFVVCKAR
ncbi:MAG TPA: phage major capsid protein [Phycisphaerae bacterium]|nr:phage major capsid protein [Phycisphaerae bacterium]